MVPTAPTLLTEYALDPLRRHIGQPLGSGGDERRLGESVHRLIKPPVKETWQ